jgi:nucleoside phosphorylase
MAETAATLARISVSQSLHGRVVILAGIAGCYEQRCEVGEVVEVISEVVSELPERFCKEYHAEMFTNLRGVSSNTVSRCNADICGADVENMEGAALFALCEEFGAECAEVRAISNYVGEAREGWNIPLALENLAHELRLILGHK